MHMQRFSGFFADGRTKQADSLVVGYRATDCIIFVAEKQHGNILAAFCGLSNIHQLDRNIMAAYEGDNQAAKDLMINAKISCLSKWYKTQHTISVLELTKNIANYNQQHRSRRGDRSFAVSLLIGGYDHDKTGHLCLTKPSGEYYEYKCYAMGRNSENVNACLEKNIGADASHDEESGIAAIIRSLLQANNVTNDLEIGVKKYHEPLKLLDPQVVKEMVKKVQRDG